MILVPRDDADEDPVVRGRLASKLKRAPVRARSDGELNRLGALDHAGELRTLKINEARWLERVQTMGDVATLDRDVPHDSHTS